MCWALLACITGGPCARAHRRRSMRAREVRITGSASACSHRRRRTRTHKRASPAAHAHAHRRLFMRPRAAHARAHRQRFHSHACGAHHRRLMRTRAFTLWGVTVVAAYLARLANLRCSRRLRGRGASANGGFARGPARGPCLRLD
jgi:hypothetical protein